ncbi:hypothetical protein B0A89_00745 [Paracoccus contaminans]|uniref:Uncharacterized protein n=2 Tax=Paracoccus contaminans TaxID=1945662 RepID=A0A1W6CU58_9RHOB|nr:hypothetical protein B0A89_00745 [Paracoccus contaminans]
MLFVLLSAGYAAASSEGTWDAMRQDIHDRCLALRNSTGSAGETVIEVNPFGSERFGAAILTTRLNGGASERTICIYDKETHAAELTAPFPE